jgi:hypothetical protein
MKLYYFTKSEHGLDNIAKRRIRISRLKDLNDPFELLASDQSDQALRIVFQNLKDKIHEGTGLICFSESWSNPVIWSHYADRHRGVCLGFEVEPSVAKKVIYSRYRLKHTMHTFSTDNSNLENVMLECIATKFSHWKYESEWRAFIKLDHNDKEGDNYFLKLNDSIKMTAVIVGANSDTSRQGIEEAIAAGGYSIGVESFKARPAFKTFRIVKNRNPRLWI